MCSVERAHHLFSRLLTLLFTQVVRTGMQRCGRGARVCPPFRFHGLHRISLGERVIIHRDCWLQVISDTAHLEIANDAAIGMGAQISAVSEITIGEHALLARNVYISDHAHAYKDVNRSVSIQGIDSIAPVHVGPHTWLGQNVVVLPGTNIGKHCVIGANSVVNSSIPDFCVAVGAPARVVRQYSEKSKQWERVHAAVHGPSQSS